MLLIAKEMVVVWRQSMFFLPLESLIFQGMNLYTSCKKENIPTKPPFIFFSDNNPWFCTFCRWFGECTFNRQERRNEWDHSWIDEPAFKQHTMHLTTHAPEIQKHPELVKKEQDKGGHLRSFTWRKLCTSSSDSTSVLYFEWWARKSIY